MVRKLSELTVWSPLLKQVLGGYGSSDDESPRSEEDDDGAGPMEVEVPRNPRPPKPVPDADGWTTVPSRHRSK